MADPSDTQQCAPNTPTEHPHQPSTPHKRAVLAGTNRIGFPSQASTTNSHHRRLRTRQNNELNQTPTKRVPAIWLLRKEVIQPHLPVRLPCYDLVLITSPTFDDSLPQGVRPPASGVTDFHDLTGGVYKPRERIHRSVADLRLLATPTS